MVFHKRDHAGSLGRKGILFVAFVLFVFLPESSLGIEHEAVLFFRLTTGPAEVDPPELGGLAVDEFGHFLAVLTDAGDSAGGAAAVFDEPHGGTEVVAEADSFLFVAVDPLAAFRRDVLETEKVGKFALHCRLAMVTEIRARPAGYRVQVAAAGAQFGAAGEDVVADGQNDLVDRVFGAFVVDDRPGAELGDRQEPGPREEFVAPFLSPATRNVGRERQPRETVAGQETFAGKVAIAVEVGLDQVLGLGEQFELRFCFLAETLGLGPVVGGSRGIDDDAVLPVALVHGSAVEVSPTLASVFKRAAETPEDLVEPAFAVPIGCVEIGLDGGEDLFGPFLGTGPGRLLVEVVLHMGQQGQDESVRRRDRECP